MNVRLMVQDARQIRDAHEDGESVESIAARFRIRARVVQKVVANITHRIGPREGLTLNDFRHLFALVEQADQNLGVVLDGIDGCVPFKVQDFLCAARGRIAQVREHLEDKMLVSHNQLGFESERVQ